MKTASGDENLRVDMKGPVSWLRRGTWLCAALAVLLAACWMPSTRVLFEAAAVRLRPIAVLAVLPVQLAASLLCTLSLWWLRPGPPFLACMVSRVLRDAGGNLLVIAPGLGEIAGVRLLVLAGGRSEDAVGASALDVLAETIAQLPFAALAMAAVPGLWTLSGFSAPNLTVIAPVALALTIGGVGFAARGARATALRDWIVRCLSSLRTVLSERRAVMPTAVLLHLFAWGSGGVQVFLAAHAMGFHLSFWGAVVIESFAYAVRGCLFVVPAGLGVQEASFVAAGLIFGLSPEQGLAVSLLLRLRDILIGAPALLAWPVFELLSRESDRNLAAPSR